MKRILALIVIVSCCVFTVMALLTVVLKKDSKQEIDIKKFKASSDIGRSLWQLSLSQSKSKNYNDVNDIYKKKRDSIAAKVYKAK